MEQIRSRSVCGLGIGCATAMKLSSTGLVLTLLDKFGSVTPIMATPAISLTEAQATIKALVMAGRLVESRQDGKVVYTLNK